VQVEGLTLADPHRAAEGLLRRGHEDASEQQRQQAQMKQPVADDGEASAQSVDRFARDQRAVAPPPEQLADSLHPEPAGLDLASQPG
jgi:hypothetical protein